MLFYCIDKGEGLRISVLNHICKVILMMKDGGYVLKEYDISIKETLEKTVMVEAATREETVKQAATIDVLLVKPFMYPQQVSIGCNLKELQKAVGGDIATVYPFDDPVTIICNDEGKINGSELNRSLRDENGEIYDIVAGDFLVAGLTEDDFGSLSPELMQKYEELFHQPEMYVQMGHSIMAIPVPDGRVRKSDVPAKTEMAPHKSAPNRDILE